VEGRGAAAVAHCGSIVEGGGLPGVGGILQARVSQETTGARSEVGRKGKVKAVIEGLKKGEGES